MGQRWGSRGIFNPFNGPTWGYSCFDYNHPIPVAHLKPARPRNYRGITKYGARNVYLYHFAYPSIEEKKKKRIDLIWNTLCFYLVKKKKMFYHVFLHRRIIKEILSTGSVIRFWFLVWLVLNAYYFQCICWRWGIDIFFNLGHWTRFKDWTGDNCNKGFAILLFSL